MYLVFMAREDTEGFLRAMLAPLSAARPGQPLAGVPFSREAVANAFVMLGLLPEPRAEEILAEYRPGLEAKGFRFGVLTGELSVRSGAHGFQQAQAAGRDGLTGTPLAVAAGPVPIAMGGVDLSLIWATLTPGGARLGSAPPVPATAWPPRGPWPALSRRPYRAAWSAVAEEIRSGLSVTDNLGHRYRLRPIRWSGASGQPGQPVFRWDGEMLVEPELRVAEPGASGAGPAGWSSLPRLVRPSVSSDICARQRCDRHRRPTVADAWPSATWQCSRRSRLCRSARTGATVELDTAEIVAAVADALLWTGPLPPDSALLSGGTATGGGRLGVAGAAGAAMGPPCGRAGRVPPSRTGRAWRSRCRCGGHGRDRGRHRAR